MEKIKVLLPGKFKPFTDGHYTLINNYLNTEETEDITIVVSKKVVNGIKPETSKAFIDEIYKDDPRVKVRISKEPSPVSECYKIVEDNPGTYAMASSTKDRDNKRSDDFVNYFKNGNKNYTPKKNRVGVKYSMDISKPHRFEGRHDKNEGFPISASVLRMDIRHDDYESFRSGYYVMLEDKVLTEEYLREYYELLRDDYVSEIGQKAVDNIDDIEYIEYDPEKERMDSFDIDFNLSTKEETEDETNEGYNFNILKSYRNR